MTTENQDSKSVGSVSKERFFLGRDHDYTLYLVPVSCRAEWDTWLNRVDFKRYDRPTCARELDGSLSRLTFTDPVQD